MAKKKEPEIVKPDPKQEILNNITNLCVNIGDKSFLIRQTEAEITQYYAQIDALRTQLGALQSNVGPEANPAK